MKHLMVFEGYKEYAASMERDRVEVEDLFIEYVDKWDMKPGKYLSNAITQPRGFDWTQYSIFYTVHSQFNEGISLLHTDGNSDRAIEISLECFYFDISRKDELLEDMMKFANRIRKWGYEVYLPDQVNHRFLNSGKGPGDTYSNWWHMYVYKSPTNNNI